ncbi:hypothetical protein O181_068445 [Austropuccinia psidii MF-1]|uniref:Uncharacterized protein n=1 Tax=Austropuccinia psidii MF-1 TaxID=1389203 RepID=A0A9Q3I727_9BASI|nr:hypothetical protein [Austropuccinia psidii MF-1]
MTDACDACQQAHEKCLFVVRPFQPHGQRSSCPRFPHRDSFVVANDESIAEREWTPGHQTGRLKRFQTISPVPSSIYLSTPLRGHHPMVTLLLDWSEVIIQPMKDGNGRRTFELGPIVTHGIQTPKTKHTKSPMTRLTCSLYASQANAAATHSSELTLPPFVEPSQHHERPISGPSQPSEPHEDALTHEPEPEVAPTQSMEKPFG